MDRTALRMVMCLAMLGTASLLVIDAFMADADRSELSHIQYIDPQTAREGVRFELNVSEYIEWNASGGNLTYRDDSPLIKIDAVTGLLEWVPTNEDIGDHFFTITITDELGRSDQQEIKITVEGIPYVPPPPPVGGFTLIQGEPFLYDWSIHFSEMDDLQYRNDQMDLFIIDQDTGVIDFIPENHHVGEWYVTITVTDSFGLSDSIGTKFTIENVNDPPVLHPIHTQYAIEDVPHKVILSYKDPDMMPRLSDPSTPVDPGERLTFRTSLPYDSVFEDTGILTWTPTEEDANRGRFIVQFNVLDTSMEGDVETGVFWVEDVTDPPLVEIVGLIEGQKLKEGKTISLRASVWGEDWDPSGNTLFLWYAGTEIIGAGTEIDWRVRGSGNEQVRLVLTDSDFGEVHSIKNVTIIPPPVHHGEAAVRMVLCIGSILGIAVVAVLVIFWWSRSADRYPGYKNGRRS